MIKAPLSAKTHSERFLFRHAPEGYPIGHPADRDTGIPSFRFVGKEAIPDQLFSFDDLGRAKGVEARSGVTFYKQDAKFANHLMQPLQYLERFLGFHSVISPDLTITAGMEPWERINNVRLARQAGVIWQEHGVKVVVNVRWCDSNDYELVSIGIPEGSVIAVSNYGLVRDPILSYEFNRGLPEIVDLIKPQAIIVHGKLDSRLLNKVQPKTEVVTFPPNSWRGNAPIMNVENPTLF